MVTFTFLFVTGKAAICMLYTFLMNEVHANFLVNTGGAKSSDILALINEIKLTVKKLKNIDLNLELNIIGEEESPARICSHA